MVSKEELKLPCLECEYVWEVHRTKYREINDRGVLECLQCGNPIIFWSGKLSYQYASSAFVNYKLYLEKGGTDCARIP